MGETPEVFPPLKKFYGGEEKKKRISPRMESLHPGINYSSKRFYPPVLIKNL